MTAGHSTKIGILAALSAALSVSVFAPAAFSQDDGDDIDAPKKPTVVVKSKKTAEFTELPEISAFLTVDNHRIQVKIMGYSDKKVLVRDMQGKDAQYKKAELQSVDFRLEIEENKVQEHLLNKRWEEAAAELINGVMPVLPCIDLYENNAVEYLMDAGNYIMTSALEEELKCPPDKLSPKAEDKFKRAYRVYLNVEKADWHPEAKVAQLKAVLCLLHLGKLDKASEKFDGIGEPEMGDRGYGLYYMTYGQILYRKKEVKEALMAAIKSSAFDNKDLDSFPEALLLSGRCYEDILDYHRARDVYYEVARLFRKTAWGDAAYNKLRFIMDKKLLGKKEKTEIEKVFFDTDEDLDKKVADFIKQKEEDDKKDKAEDEERKKEDEERKKEQEKEARPAASED